MKNTTSTQTDATKKNAGYRVFAAILVALAVGALFLPYAYVVTPNGAEEMGFFWAIKELFSGNAFTLFGFLPTLVEVSSISTLFAAFTFYLLLLCTVLTVIFGIATIFCKKKAPAMLRVTTFCLTIGYAFYTIFVLLTKFVFKGDYVIDFVGLGVTAFTAITFFVLACLKLGKKAIVNAISWVLSLIVSAGLILAICLDLDSFALGVIFFGVKSKTLYEIIMFAILVLCVINMFIASIRVATKKGLVLDLIRFILFLLISGVVVFFQIRDSFSLIAFIAAIAAAAVSLIQIVICIIQMCLNKKAKKNAATTTTTEEVVEETTEKKAEKKAVEEVPEVVEEVQEQPAAPVAEVAPVPVIVEEYAEAVPYEGGVVEGVEMAEEVVEEPKEAPVAAAPAVETADYDYYNSRSFDPFIATLSNEERNQFTELFIVKYKGTMSEIPDYVVGGNNKDFFRKIFIYLGQYRNRIPDGLLAKIYDFASKL